MYGTDTSFTNSNGDFTVAANGGNGAASRFDVQSWFAKATTEFETFGVEHNFGLQANGYMDDIRRKNRRRKSKFGQLEFV